MMILLGATTTLSAARRLEDSLWCRDLTLEDSYGDGWNGGTFSVFDAGANLLQEVAMVDGDGFRKTFEICLPLSSCYSIVVTEGQFPSEISWVLGNATLAGGAPFVGDFSLSDSGELSACTASPTLSPAPTITPVPSLSPTVTRLCLDLFLEDSFGDGWNGAELLLSGDDVTAFTMEVEDGLNVTESVCLLPGCYDIEVTEGDYPSEISWSFGLIFKGDAPFKKTTVFVDNSGKLIPDGCTSSPTMTPQPSTAAPTAPTSRPSLTAAPTKTRPCFNLIFESSSGDGWNGAFYDIIDEATGAFLAGGSLFDGAQRTETICADPSPCYLFTVSAGLYPSQVSWKLGSLSGGAPFESLFSVSEEEGIETQRCTFPPTSSLMPSISPLPSPQPTLTLMPTRTTVCFDLILEDSFGDGWNGAFYEILDDSTKAIVADGALDFGLSKRTDETCVLASSCYSLRINGQLEIFPSEVSLTLGNLTASGNSDPFVSFFVTDTGRILTGDFCTSAPTVSPAPTATFAPLSRTNAVCVDITLYESFYSYGSSAYVPVFYSIVDSFGIVVADGTLYAESYANKTDVVCLSPRACYSLNVTADSGPWPSDFEADVSWEFGKRFNPSLSGSVPFYGEFLVGDSNVLRGQGCTSPPTVSPAPTLSPRPSSEPTITLQPTLTRPCFDLFLEDDYGDGWNGAIYEIADSKNGIVVAIDSLLDGFNRTDNICLTPSCYAITVTSGDFPDEISWSLAGGALEGGANAVDATFLLESTGVTSGCGGGASPPTMAPTV